MRLHLFTHVVSATLSLPAAALAAGSGCCEQHQADHAMACCKDHKAAHPAPAKSTGADVMTEEVISIPVRQSAVVWFHRPVWVGRLVLMGQYIIEHDTDRQARGEPCTHIYAMDDRQTPVVAFHCTHLDADPVDRSEVVLRSMGDGMRKLVRFQFAGEDAAHVVPAR